MIYTDGIHLVGNLEKLHEFAAKIGLKREWFQDHPRHPHYDLMGGKAKKAIAAGAHVISKKLLSHIAFISSRKLDASICLKHGVSLIDRSIGACIWDKDKSGNECLLKQLRGEITQCERCYFELLYKDYAITIPCFQLIMLK